MREQSTMEADAASKPSEGVLREILTEIAVPDAVLTEARTRRDLVLSIAHGHPAGRETYSSGSVAHGTTNRPLEDADGGVVVDRRFEAFRAFGPDASGGGRGPTQFVAMFAEHILPRVRRHYPNAELDLEGKRPIKVELNETVEIDDWGAVDPYVDLIVALARADGRGLWIPDLHSDSWDPGDPIRHTYLMAKHDPKSLRVFRARILRLAKRAVKRDALIEGHTPVVCSWNLSALALEYAREVAPIADGLAGFLAYASQQLANGLTEDPSPVITDPIKLPEGVTNERASQRLGEMAAIVADANAQLSVAGARTTLEQLYGPELEAVRERQRTRFDGALRAGDMAVVAEVLDSPAQQKPTRSYGE